MQSVAPLTLLKVVIGHDRNFELLDIFKKYKYSTILCRVPGGKKNRDTSHCMCTLHTKIIIVY
jgi:hypothetical protein